MFHSYLSSFLAESHISHVSLKQLWTWWVWCHFNAVSQHCWAAQLPPVGDTMWSALRVELCLLQNRCGDCALPSPLRVPERGGVQLPKMRYFVILSQPVVPLAWVAVSSSAAVVGRHWRSGSSDLVFAVDPERSITYADSHQQHQLGKQALQHLYDSVKGVFCMWKVILAQTQVRTFAYCAIYVYIGQFLLPCSLLTREVWEDNENFAALGCSSALPFPVANISLEGD